MSKWSPSFSEDNLVSCTLDLFLAGTETTSTTLRWALLYMALCPEIQGKIQAEIDRVVGQSRLPTMADRENMPYTNAAVHEIQRMGNIVPFNVPRMSTVDTTVAGYHVPKVNNWNGLPCLKSPWPSLVSGIPNQYFL
uniref:Uncharacterized protein n=1 Tax=Monodelphis domestica TaxID=13616 RepID=H9H5W2_MONDO